MKIISGGRSSNYLLRVGIFLTIAALIVGMAGCDPVQYNLTISSTEGGEVTTPGEGMFTYNEGTTVDLVAEADKGYRFVHWTGDVGAIADTDDATTTITMNGDYTIAANFAIATEIWDWYDLDAIRYNLDPIRCSLVGNYTLMNDLNSTTTGYEELASPTANEGKGWEPIGILGMEFEGAFDGQGYEISELFINRPDDVWGVGLFGCVGELGVVRNIGMVNADITGGSAVGGLAGVNTGEVTGCYATGSVSGEWMVGGLAGAVCSGLLGCPGGPGTLSKSYAIVNVIGIEQVGGLVGINDSPVTNCYSIGNVTGNSSVGGLVGVSVGTVTNCYSTGSVAGNTSTGGLVGENTIAIIPFEGTVSNSFWDTETSGQSTSDGGTGKNTTEMQDIATFSGAGWDITAVANPSIRNLSYIWNIVDDVTYPFLGWQP